MNAACLDSFAKGTWLADKRTMPGTVTSTDQTDTGKQKPRLWPLRGKVRTIIEAHLEGKELAKLSVRMQRSGSSRSFIEGTHPSCPVSSDSRPGGAGEQSL